MYLEFQKVQYKDFERRSGLEDEIRKKHTES